MEGMKEYPDKFFDLAIVDPPYGIGDFSMQTSGGNNGRKVKHIWNYSWNDFRPSPSYFIELIRISKNQIIWGANYYNCFPSNGGAIIWNKNNKHPNMSKCEIASCSFHKKVEYVEINGLGFLKKNPSLHPCEKPIALYRWLLENYAKPGDKLLDTHVGSASSLIACEALGFEYVGFEIDKDYYEAAKKRLETWRSLPLFDEKKAEESNQLDLAI